MSKVDLELVKMVLHRAELDVRVVSQIIEDINEEASANAPDPTPPQPKKQFVILVSDPNGELDGKDFTGWVLQIPEDDSPHAAEERLVRAAYEYNLTPKGRRLPVRKISEVCEFVSGRILKEQGVAVKTKETVYVLRTTNQIPMDALKKLSKTAAE